MGIWVHDNVKSEVEFILNRIRQQRAYINEVKGSDRRPEKKAELIDSAKCVKWRFQAQLGEYMEKGLIAII
jgi:hypothetical protein